MRRAVRVGSCSRPVVEPLVVLAKRVEDRIGEFDGIAGDFLHERRRLGCAWMQLFEKLDCFRERKRACRKVGCDPAESLTDAAILRDEVVGRVRFERRRNQCVHLIVLSRSESSE